MYEHYGVTEAVYYRGLNLVAQKIDGYISHYLYDQKGSVTGGANRTGTTEYDAFGVQRTSDRMPYNPFRYNGEYYDQESGLIYLRNRYYDPATGRFMTEDPYWNPDNMIYGDDPGNTVPSIEAMMQSSNLYVYGMNNPIMYVDPYGTFSTNTVLSIGIKSVDVRNLQERLNELGYRDPYGNALSEDGIYGDNTAFAVRQFQSNSGLAVDGLVGKNTWDALGLPYDSTFGKISTTAYDARTKLFAKGFSVSSTIGFLGASGNISVAGFGQDFGVTAWGIDVWNAEGSFSATGLSGNVSMFSTYAEIRIPIFGRTLALTLRGDLGAFGRGGKIQITPNGTLSVSFNHSTGIGIEVSGILY